MTTEAFSAVLIGVPTAVETVTATPSLWCGARCLHRGGDLRARGLWIASVWFVSRDSERLATCFLNEEHDEPQRAIGTRAEIRYLAGLRQPVTFGATADRPTARLASCAGSSRAAGGAFHELIHVQRHDWMWLVAEEVVRHRLVSSRHVVAHLARAAAREEVVDELAMLATGTRRGIEALAAFADETPLVPAAAFARRRHLFRRMQLIAREAGMSSRQLRGRAP